MVASARAGAGGEGECEHGEPGVALFVFAVFSVAGFILVRLLPETLGEEAGGREERERRETETETETDRQGRETTLGEGAVECTRDRGREEERE